MAHTKVEKITTLHQELVGLENMLTVLHTELRYLIDAPVTAEYKLAVSLGRMPSTKESVLEEDGSLRTGRTQSAWVFVGLGLSQPPPKPKQDKLKVPVNVRVAVKVMEERQLNKLVGETSK